MKCEQCRTLIEDYFDGALDSRDASLVNAHIVACAACASLREDLIREREIYSRYERDVEITPMLWSSIEARIKRERGAQAPGFGARVRERFAAAFAARRLSPALAAALVVIAIGITVAVMSYLNSRKTESVTVGKSDPSATKSPGTSDNPTPVPKSPENNPPAKPGREPETIARYNKPAPIPKHRQLTSEPTPEQLVREAEQKYLSAIAILSRDVNRRRSQLDPMMLARFDASLSEVDRSITETRRVVHENPEDPIALQYLLAAYSKKVEMLRGMTAD